GATAHRLPRFTPARYALSDLESAVRAAPDFPECVGVAETVPRRMGEAMNFRNFCLVGVGMLGLIPVLAQAGQSELPPTQDRVSGAQEGDTYSLRNRLIAATVSVAGGRLGGVVVQNRTKGA